MVLGRVDDGIDLSCDVCLQECMFCGSRCGACIQCNHARCQNTFHPMCALLSGAQFHISPWSNNSTQMSVSCKGHAHKHDKVSTKH